MSIDIRLNKLEMDSAYLPINPQDVANKQYVDNTLGATVPSGVVVAFTGASAPAGWLLCDGTAVGRTAFAALFTAIGTTHGQGDGSTTFNVPDYRSRFLRGVDGSANLDPDKTSRTAMNAGGQTGNAVGSVQTDALQGHFHGPHNAGSYVMASSSDPGANALSTGGGQISPSTGSPVTDGSHGTPRLSSESRPVNAYVNFIIKT
jgi:microcystin-dependent protein